MSKSKGTLKLRQYLQEKVRDANGEPEDLTRLTVDELKRLNQLTKAYEADEEHALMIGGKTTNTTLYPRCTRLPAHLRPTPVESSRQTNRLVKDSDSDVLLAQFKVLAHALQAEGHGSDGGRSLR